MRRARTVALVGDDPLALDTLARRLEQELPGANLHALGTEASSPEADVIVWDLGTSTAPPSERPGAAPAVALVDRAAQIPVALALGAVGALSRYASPERVAAAVAAAASGLYVVEEDGLEHLARARPMPAGLPEPLTRREREVLDQLSLGLTNRQIAERLGMSLHTAKFHVNAVMGKLGAASRTEAVGIAARAGLITF